MIKREVKQEEAVVVALKQATGRYISSLIKYGQAKGEIFRLNMPFWFNGYFIAGLDNVRWQDGLWKADKADWKACNEEAYWKLADAMANDLDKARRKNSGLFAWLRRLFGK